MSPRMSAEDRREQVIRAAVTEFSIRGLEGTSTADIAKRVGVSQPYLFRLFPTKKALFIEACKRGADRVVTTLTEAAEGKYGIEALSSMGHAYQELLDADREVLMMQLQQYAACHDEEIQTEVSACMQEIWQAVENLTGAPIEVRVAFFAKGMLCNTIAAMRGGRGADPQWAPVLDAMHLMAPGGEPCDDHLLDSVADSATDGDRSATDAAAGVDASATDGTVGAETSGATSTVGVSAVGVAGDRPTAYVIAGVGGYADAAAARAASHGGSGDASTGAGGWSGSESDARAADDRPIAYVVAGVSGYGDAVAARAASDGAAANGGMS